MSFLFFCLLFALICAAPVEESDKKDYKVPIDLTYLGRRVFGDPNSESGKRLDDWNESSEVNADEMGDYAEGDILFPQKLRSGLISEVYRWKDAEVPYEIADDFLDESKEIIQKAMDMYRKYTCIT